MLSDISYEQGDFVFALLLNTSQFEFRLRTILKKLLENRETKWETAKQETRIRLSELSEIYGKTNNDTNGATSNSSSPNMTSSSSRRLVKSDHLEKWFIERERQVEELTLNGKKSQWFICVLGSLKNILLNFLVYFLLTTSIVQ